MPFCDCWVRARNANRELLFARPTHRPHGGEDAAAGFLFVENHCPVCAAATACQELCRSELMVFRAVLGTDVTVERIDHLLAGARRCAYRIALKCVPATNSTPPKKEKRS